MFYGRGSLVVKVSDRGWHVTNSSSVPLNGTGSTTLVPIGRYSLQQLQKNMHKVFCAIEAFGRLAYRPPNCYSYRDFP
ncbi:hypothetical protein TNCV_937711 [Trichonephila clavipes]|nr:hypothetical protein TNCV_937711 [Trichonephila clavipes]